MPTSWLWIERRRAFMIMLAATVALSLLCAANYDPSPGARPLAQHVGEWHSNQGATFYLIFVIVLAHSGISASRGLRREVLQSLPIAGRGWVESQWRVVGALAVILAFVSHGAVTVFAWGLSGELVPVQQSLVHAARWAVGAWFVFGVVVAVEDEATSVRRGLGAWFLVALATIVCGAGPQESFEWDPSSTSTLTSGGNPMSLILAVIFGWIGAGVAARRIDRGE